MVVSSSFPRAVALTLVALWGSSAEKSGDQILSLPGFPAASSWGFKAYSGILDVPGPINGYDSLKIHYQFHTSRRNPSSDPLLAWHQGGPGGSSINIGLYGEMGAFQIGDSKHGNYINPFGWNRIANMLYLESPAGSGKMEGYSQCIRAGSVTNCSWTDRTQAEAYAHTLLAFFREFPEFSHNDFYLTGESYFGQYGPNIARYILEEEQVSTKINLRGIAAGNACWGGTESCVACNGPSQDRIDVEFFFGKGLYSPKLKKLIDETCKFPTVYKTGTSGAGPFDCDTRSELSTACSDLLSEMRMQVGPHNVYNVYDNCPQTKQFLSRIGKDMEWLTQVLRGGLHNATATSSFLKDMNGGFTWDCGGNVSGWINSARTSLHLDGVEAGASHFSYLCTGPASITLWPELVRKMRVLIYNGDADACVPYVGNEEWVSKLEDDGILEELKPWSPWYANNKAAPAGYITKYQAYGTRFDFYFATIRLAGHMAPTFQPEASLAMLEQFLAGGMEHHMSSV